MSQWPSGSMLARGIRSPRIELRCGQVSVFFTKITAAFGTRLKQLTAVPRLTQPSTVRKTVNEYQPYTNGDGQMFGL